MTEAETRAALLVSVAVGEVEHWIAAQPWRAAPGRWEVRDPLQESRFRVEPVPTGVCVTAFSDVGEPVAWTVPAAPRR